MASQEWLFQCFFDLWHPLLQRFNAVNVNNSASDRDQLTAGEHYWVPAVSLDPVTLQMIADHAYPGINLTISALKQLVLQLT